MSDPLQDESSHVSHDDDINDSAIAIIGMDGRFPGAPNLDAYWSLLDEGREGVASFRPDELEAVPAGMRADDPRLVRAQGVLDGVEDFDAQFFNIPAREARWLDPQQRLFLETCWHALENAGYDPERYDDAISVYAGVNSNTYLLSRLHGFDRGEGADLFQVMLASEKDFLTTRVAYKLNLRGESIGIQTSCSTSLVAVHMACQSLLGGQSAIALAGGVSIRLPQRVGYVFQEGMIASPDGHCRPFDEAARGTVPGSGVGVVVLKLLADAVRDGDHVHAVILGSAINNDGRIKAGFTAPSAAGQSQVISRALAMAGVEPDSIGMIEAHGTGTQLGDPIEVEALTRAFRRRTERRGFCALGSVKSNIGHLDAAAGVAGLIKAVLALRHRRIPGTLHFRAANPALRLKESPFFVPAAAQPWHNEDGAPLRCGVSSFGVGGTNAHVVLEQAPPRAAVRDTATAYLYPLSANTPTALQTMAANLADHLVRHPQHALQDIAATLALGRREFAVRAVVVARGRDELVARLRELASPPPGSADAGLAFEIADTDAVPEGIDVALSQRFPAYRDAWTHAAGVLREQHQSGPSAVPDPDRGDVPPRGPEHAWPLLLVRAHARASLWRALGIVPDAVIGQGAGAMAAAYVAGVLTIEDGLRLARDCGRILAARAEDEDTVVALRELFAATPRSAPAITLRSASDGMSLSAADAIDPEHLARRCLPLPAVTVGSPTPANDVRRVRLCDAAVADDAEGTLLADLGTLWTRARPVRWDALFANEEVRRIPLPTYPFQRQRFWIDLPAPQAAEGDAAPTPPLSAEVPTPAHRHPVERNDVSTPFVPPRDELEASVIEAWESILGLEGIGRDDDFFELGGDSLLGTQVYSRLAEAFPGRAELGDVLSSGSVAALADRIRKTDAGAAASVEQDEGIAVVARDGDLPLSFGQQWLWSFDHVFPGSPAYNLPFAARVRGALDTDTLSRTLSAIVERHEVLRSHYPDHDGVPVQRIRPPEPLLLPIVDLSGEPQAEREARLPSLVEVEARKSFDLRDGPLIRALLVRLGEDDHLVVVTLHHIVSDAWSMAVFGREFAEFYAAFRDARPVQLPRLKIQYTDYAAWQHKRLGSDGAVRLLDYWKRQLSGAPQLLELPGDRPRPARPSGHGARVSFAFDPALGGALRELAQRHRATLFMVLLSGFSALLQRLSGQDDILIGVPLAGRTRSETEDLIGCFISTVVIRTDHADNPRFGALLKQVRDTTLAAYAHQDIPFERVVNACQVRRDASHSPLVQVLFDFQNMPPRPPLRIDGLDIAPIGPELATAKLDLVVDMWEREGRMSGSVEFNTDLFDATTIERLMRRFEILLRDAASRPDARLAALALDEPRAGDERRGSFAQVVPTPISLTSARGLADSTMQQKTSRPSPFAATRPSSIRMDQDAIVAFAPFAPEPGFPFLATPTVPDVDLATWFAERGDAVRERLSERGAVLFRGFGLASAEDFRRLTEIATPDLLQYRERSTPRSTVQGRVYTSTEYPPEQHIPLHNENAYSHLWPGRVWFFCRQAAQQGGETPLADSRAVYRRLDPRVIERFVEKRVMYVRNYRDGIDLDWRKSFQTDDRADVERYCDEHGIEFEWLGPEHLRTRQVRQAVARHPLTGDTVWFNQAHLFHVSALPADVAASLLALHGEADFPRNAYYGDGSPIESESLAHIHATYRELEVCFPWHSGDALLVDNLLVAHGRRPFSGPRSVLVAMADPMTAA